MANAYVTFSKGRQPGLNGDKPVARGADIRTETILIGATSVPTTLAALAGDDFVEIEAGGACWILIGPGTPVAAAVTTTGLCRHMAANSTRQFSVQSGDKVAVITE